MSLDDAIGSRKEYLAGGIEPESLLDDPITQLQIWVAEAKEAGQVEPNAMCVSTSTPEGHPSARMVLLRGLDERGLTFYTNYESRKGLEIAENPWVCATFWWGGMERQVRIEGRIERVSVEESDAYFHSRPYESQAASAASPQSQVVRDREELEAYVFKLKQENPTEISRPENWGGFRIEPKVIEFWQGRAARLHDRIRYRRNGEGWMKERLAP